MYSVPSVKDAWSARAYTSVSRGAISSRVLLLTYDRHVQGCEHDDGFSEQEDPRPREGHLELLRHGLARLPRVQLGDEDLARQLGKLVSALAKDHRSVCLRDRERADDPDKACKACHKPLNPSPRLLAQEAAGDRPNGRPQEGRSREDGRGHAPLRGREHVGNDAPGIGHWRRAKGAGKETEDDEGLNVGGRGCSSIEGSQCQIGPEEEDLAAEKFRQRGPEKRSRLSCVSQPNFTTR